MPGPEDALIRRRPPHTALRWAEMSVGEGARVRRVRRLGGGFSAAIHALDLETRSGASQRLVLRRFVRADWLAEEPDLPKHEAAVLRLLERTSLPAPRLVAVDEDGRRAGVPSVLMTWLPGKVELAPRDADAWLARIAALLPEIHALDPAATDLPYQYAPYTDPRDVEVPAWTSQQENWAAIIDFARGPRPETATRLIHRDYHPTNLLWIRGQITGIVDWVNACRGPAGIDIGHCRRNLAIARGVEAADRFLEHCRVWANYHPYWDVLSLLDADLDAPVYAGWLDLHVQISPELARARLDEYAASLASRI